MIKKIEDCTIKKDRAEKLTGGLGKEKDKWIESKENLKIAKENLLGDIIISSATIAYLGAFSGKYRDQVVYEQIRAAVVE